GELSDLTIYMDAECNYTLPTAAESVTELIAVGGITAITDCNLDQVVTYNDVQDNDNSCDRFYTRTYTVKDSCGNETTTVQTIHILDNIHPAITGELTDLTIYMDAECNYTLPTAAESVTELIAVGGITAITDCNLDPVVTSNDVQDNNNTCDRFYTRTYTVKDSCGNETTTVQTIHILDNIAPAITGELTDLTIYMDAECNYTLPTAAESVTELIAIGGITAITDCNLDPVVTSNDVQDNNNTCDRFYTRTYTVKDSCGNETTTVQTIHILDNIHPAITGELTDLTIYMDAECNYTLPTAAESVTELIAVGGITAITDCNLDPVVTYNDVQDNNNSCDRFYTRTYTVKDSCGNETTAVQTIHVLDNINPAITGELTDLTIYMDAECNYTLPTAAVSVTQLITIGGITAITDCNLDPVVTYTDVQDNNNSCDRFYTRTYTVKDSCGNETTAVQTIHILDNIAPAITGTLSTQTLYVDVNCNFIYPDTAETINDLIAEGLTSVEDCNLSNNVVIVSDVLNEPNLCDRYVIRTYTVSDSCGNSVNISQRFNVLDTIKPWFTAVIPNQPANSVGGCVFNVPDLTNIVRANSADNCTTDLIVAQDIPAGTVITDTTDVTVTIEDSCHNSSTFTLSITVPQTLTATISTVNVTCYGMANGVATIHPIGGTTPYTYSCALNTPYTVVATAATINTLPIGDYTYTVIDDDGCFVDVAFEITQPALLVATLSISDASSCETDDVTTTATVVGGTAPYNYSWERLDEYNVSTPLSSTIDNIVTAEEDGSYAYVVTVVDDTNCVATDTIYSQVNPIYFFEDTARICSGFDYNWVGHRIIPAAELPDSETEYDIYDSLTTTGFGCDSIWVLHLTVTDYPYFELREDGEPNALREIAIYDTVSTGSADKIYELFVRKNCTDCDTKVSIEYEIYRYDSGIGDYVLIPSNVTDYFTPNYVTYLDQSNISYISPSTSQVSIPNLYPNAGLGVARHFDYYNLCFLSPEYACNPVITPSPLPFYSYGRANLINVTQWRTAGDYKILAKLQERTGGSGWGTQGYCPSDGTMGGHQATLTPLVFDIAEIFIHVNQGAGPVIPMRPISFDYITPPTVQTIVPEVNIYPNPAQDYFTIELTGFEGETQVALSNVDGGVVEQLNVNVTEDTRIIRVSSGNYAAGVYVVSARNNDVTLTRRVVIVR
ncbi:MAG: T9SS type A sorting domain-containing protein, partial [Bacteroidales bacterium]|nr:T9SS type A sorting domain-containing protein [Bacteroidales bacterium]